MSAETQTNWMPRVLGSMSLRPGLGYLGATKSNAVAKYLEFIFSTSDKALIELTNNVMRVWVDDALVTRTSVSTAVTNGSFSQYSDTVTISNASPGVVTYAGADNWANNDPVVFQTTGALPTGLTAGTTYYVKNLNAGANTFEVSATAGGASINTSSAGSGTHTAYAYYYISGWTKNDQSGAVSQWAGGPYLELIGNGTNYAIRDQQVTVGGADLNKEHALRIVIQRGPVTLKIGSTSGGAEYMQATLLPGYHSLAFTPTGNLYSASSQGFGETCLRPSETRSFSRSYLRTLTLISSPTEKSSEGCLMRPQLMSVMWSNPSMPPRSMNAPYSVMFFTVPVTIEPSWRLARVSAR
mgnify:CR=1 FL=1